MHDDASDIGAFVRRFRFSHRLTSAAVAAAAASVVLFAIVWIVELVAPRYAWSAAVFAVCVLLIAAVLHWRRGAPSLAAADRQLGLDDRLRTWATTEPSAVRDWLGRDVRARLQGLSVFPWRHRALRRRLRPLRTLVPLLCALLLMRHCAPGPGAAPDGGGAGGGPRAGGGEPSAVAGGGGAAPGGAGNDARPVPDPTPDPVSESPPPQDDPAEDPPADADPLGAPEALLEDLPSVDDFLIPHFIAEGADPGEVVSGPVATVGDGTGVPSPPEGAPNAAEPEAPTRRSTDATAGSPDPLDPPPPEFDRARERALRGRHVAPDERGLVRRYFELVVERRR